MNSIFYELRLSALFFIKIIFWQCINFICTFLVKIKDLKDKLETVAVNEEPLHLLLFDDTSCTASEFGDTVTESTLMENTLMENTSVQRYVIE